MDRSLSQSVGHTQTPFSHLVRFLHLTPWHTSGNRKNKSKKESNFSQNEEICQNIEYTGRSATQSNSLKDIHYNISSIHVSRVAWVSD